MWAVLPLMSPRTVRLSRVASPVIDSASVTISEKTPFTRASPVAVSKNCTKLWLLTCLSPLASLYCECMVMPAVVWLSRALGATSTHVLPPLALRAANMKVEFMLAMPVAPAQPSSTRLAAASAPIMKLR